MNYITKKFNKKDVTGEVIFDFNHKDSRVEGSRIFLKIEKSPIPIEIGSKITFTKTLQYSNDASETKIEKVFEVLSVYDDIIELENPPINKLWCSDVMEYSKYDEEMDDNSVKSFNYIPTGYTSDYNYFVLNFKNEHNVAENEKFRLKLKTSSTWASNPYMFYNTIEELPEKGIEDRLYIIRYIGDEVEEKNIFKYWDNEKGAFFPENEISLTEDEINEKLKDLEIIPETHFYKHYNETIDNQKMQIVIPTENYDEWSNLLVTSEISVVYPIDGVYYDDRVFFKEHNEKILLSNNVSASTVANFLKFNIQLNDSHAINLFQENILKNEYVNDVINSAIPDINDYEKNIVKPYIQRDEDTFERASRIIFNLHFRDRLSVDGKITDNWSTSDEKMWNEYDTSEFDIEKSDLLWYLGFEADDVYFQKMKLQKSFLRLSFYDSNDPMNQNLLFYSTVFIDTNELFGLYNKLKANITDGEIPDANFDTDVMTVDVNGYPRLSSQFIITDKFNTEKSSEGFYLYLFNKMLPKKEPLPIYMKVEFNHAKYGKTIPFLYFTKEDNVTPDTKPQKGYINSNLKIGNGGSIIDMKSYFNDLHIKMEIRYDENTRSFIYYLPYNKRDGNDIIFNLFEPRINGQHR